MRSAQVKDAEGVEAAEKVARDVVEKKPTEAAVFGLLLLERRQDVEKESVGMVVGEADFHDVVDL
jgi:hypothetical protein